MSEEQSPRIGIVGLGNIGRYHADRLADVDAELVGGMDVDCAARRRFSADYGVPAHDDPAALYEESDGVLVATPNRYHEQHAVAALEAGLDVLLEKPLAHTLESATRIAEAASRADGFCMVGFHSRFASPVEALKGMQASGRLGDVYHVEASYVRRRGIPGLGSWFTTESVAGGGSLIDVGVHVLDLALHVLEFPDPVEVVGTTRSVFGDREDYVAVDQWGDRADEDHFDVDDSATAFVRFADGSTLTLEVAWAANAEPSQGLRVHGTETGATVDLVENDLTLFGADDAGVDHLTTTAVTTDSADTHRREFEAFVDGVRTATPPEHNSAAEALTVQRLIDAIYRSGDRGEAVRLDRAESAARAAPPAAGESHGDT